MSCNRSGNQWPEKREEVLMTEEKKSRKEEFKIDGAELVGKVKELIHQGNIRRITIKNEKGDSLMEIPLTLGIIGAALMPILAALGAMAALVTSMSIVVEKCE